MGTEIEINVEPEKEPELTPAEKAAKEAEKKDKLNVLWSTLKKLMNGQSGLTGKELDMAKADTTKQIADLMEEED
jgi:hypothetical protein